MGSINKALIILSDKSSGSSILQKELSRHPSINIVSFSQHNENETLYWIKSAAVLGLPQVNLSYSKLPITEEKALTELREFLAKNISDYVIPIEPEKMVFDGWYNLALQHSPILLEKSPHHLHCWSALNLMEECHNRYNDLDFYYIGLIRNPLDTLYSMCNRWYALPDRTEHDWVNAYQNLLKFKERVGKRLVLLSYEEMVQNPTIFKKIFKMLDVSEDERIGSKLHKRAISKWREDSWFAHSLSSQAKNVAIKFGYNFSDIGKNNIKWEVKKKALIYRYYLDKTYKKIKKRIKNILR